MAPILARAKLARAARRLNEGSRRQIGAHLPPLVLMTDDVRTPDPIAAAKLLPEGAAIILRHREKSAREKLAAALAASSWRRGLLLIVADDEKLAMRLDAGMHFPQSKIGDISRWRARRPHALITAAAHSERAILAAHIAGAHAVLLAPLFPTKSHPERSALGVSRFRLMSSRAPIAVYALGGVTAANVQRLSGAQLAGIAAIAALLPGQSP